MSYCGPHPTPRFDALVAMLRRGPASPAEIAAEVFGVSAESSARLRRCTHGNMQRLICRSRKRLEAEGLAIRWKPKRRQYVLVVVPDRSEGACG